MLTIDRLKRAALVKFAEAGYDGVTLAELAGAVGIKTPSIYAHFASKEELFLTLFAEAAQGDADGLAACLERHRGGTARERLRAMFDYYTEPADGSSFYQSFLKKTMLLPPKALKERLQQDLLTCEERLAGQLAAILADGAAAGEHPAREVGPVRALFFALTDGLLVEQGLYAPALYRERREMAWAVLWKTIAEG